jgi:hypothetical protein
MNTIKKTAKENKKAIDVRFTELFKDLLAEKRVRSVTEFSKELAVTHGNNLHSIFRAAEGGKTSIRHVNEELILAMSKVYGVNELYLRFGTLPKFIPKIQTSSTTSKKYKTPLAAIKDVFGLKDKDVAKLLNASLPRIESLVQGSKADELNVNEIRLLHAQLDIPYEFMLDFTGDADSLKKVVGERFAYYSTQLHSLLRSGNDTTVSNKKSRKVIKTKS